MSAQSIKDINIQDNLEAIDNFLICEGNAFRNIINYDLDMKVDYDKLRKVLYLKELLNRTKDCEKVNLIIDKILK